MIAAPSAGAGSTNRSAATATAGRLPVLLLEALVVAGEHGRGELLL